MRVWGTGSHDQLIGQDAQGNWKTGPAAHYPGPLCLFLAKAIAATWRQSSVASVGSSLTSGGSVVIDKVVWMERMEKEPADQQCVAKADQGHSDLALKALDIDVVEVASEQSNVVIESGCIGPPLAAFYAGRDEEFCDGFGLCSPGRWHPNNRSKKRLPEQLAFCPGLRKMIDESCERVIPDLGKGVMKLALGRCQQSPFSSGELQSLRESWFRSLHDPHRASQVTEGQPFYLHALALSLRLMGDPDVDSIDTTVGSNFIEGVHAGHNLPLGPTPQVFRPRVKQAVYDESDWTWCMHNYFRGDEKEAAQVFEQHFKEEVEGRMLPVSFKAAVQRYPGSSLRVAAQGILDKPDGGHRIMMVLMGCS